MSIDKNMSGTLIKSQTQAVAHTFKGEGFDASEDGTGRGVPIIPVGVDNYNGVITGDVAATLSSQSGDGVSAGPSVMVPILFDETQITSKENRSNPQPGDPSHPLMSQGRPPTLAIGWNGDITPKTGVEISPALRSEQGGEGVGVGLAVRRLTPVECERLQGFPDDWTRIPYRGKPSINCPDGPRYKAIGNSMAVPVMAWIGRRIDAEMKRKPVVEIPS